jgi:biotin operon repressor
METNKNEYYVVSVDDTIKYGIISASIIGRVKWWCQYNKDNKVKDRYHIEYWWSGFMSSREFSEQLGISIKTVEKNLSKLIKTGVLIKGVFNKKGFDRTGWYRVNPHPPIEETISPNRVDDLPLKSKSISPNRVNGNTPTEETIPVSITVNQNVKQTVSTPVNPPVKPLIELTDIDVKELISVVKNINAPEDTGYWVECLIKGESILNSRKEQIRKYKNYFNKGNLLPKFIEQELEH